MIKCEYAVSCAFTGHRPSKFPWKYDESAEECAALKKALRAQIIELANAGIMHFRSGVAEGTDCWAAQIVLALREERPRLKLDCIVPYKGQEEKWRAASKAVYRSILDQADSIVYVNRKKTDDCFLERNRYMVDHSSILLAIYNGERRGGTAMTVRYAQKNGREIYVIDPITRKLTHEAENRSMRK